MNYSEFLEFDKIRSRIFFRIINYDKNQKMLEDVPYLKLNDLAVVFRWLVSMDDSRVASAMITNHHVAYWNISVEELVCCANENTPELFPARLLPMDKMIEHCLEFAEDEEKDTLYEESGTTMLVLTNQMGMNGAGCLCYKGVLAQVADRLNNSFYVLPSSIHEVILLPDGEEIDSESLEKMVCSVNEELVAEDEILSNHVYYYHKEKKTLSIA